MLHAHATGGNVIKAGLVSLLSSPLTSFGIGKLYGPADVAGAALYTLDGRMVSSTRMSSILPRPAGMPGLYILQVIAADGTSQVAKIALR